MPGSALEVVATGAAFIGVSSSLLLINKLALKVVPCPSFLSVLQFACAMLFVLLIKWLGVGHADEFKWSTVRQYMVYVCLFCSSIYCNMRAISYSNLETVMVFRALAPVFICMLDVLFLGREAPSFRSAGALAMISIGGSGYVAAGYTCLGEWCAAVDPGGDPSECARALPPQTFPFCHFPCASLGFLVCHRHKNQQPKQRKLIYTSQQTLQATPSKTTNDI